MKISYQWLNEFVDLQKINPQKLADLVTLKGIEVAGVIAPDAGLKKLVVGHILKKTAHPHADHLSLCQVDLGQDDPVQIVCGAPNVAQDQYVIVALPGARIKDNVKIKRGKMRGEASDGMICSLQEIGFADDVVPKAFLEGIYVFPQPKPVGESVFKYLGMDDRLIDFDITPNRADTLGMHGAAYEVGAILHQKPRFPEVEVNEIGQKTTDLVNVQVDCPNKVPQYYLKVVQDVHIQPSPLWLQIRLWNNGIRPINNVVDVTNYVLLEYGQPLHAFDYDRVASKQIKVRTAHEKESLATLDGKKRTLNKEDLVITDGQKPLALAGVMGGLSSEITSSTKTVMIEAAVFDGTSIRKTAQRHNLHTDASTRYEKGINVDDVKVALNRAAQLMNDLANGQVSEGLAIGHEHRRSAKKLQLDPEQVNHVLGTTISKGDMMAIFTDLNFDHRDLGDQIEVTVPARRWDIHIEADLIEEVIRLYGYDRLPSTLPTGRQTIGHYNRRQRLIRIVKRHLLAAGLDEVISYSLLTKEQAMRFTLSTMNPIQLQWPMTHDHAYLRQNLISGLIQDLQYNLAHKQKNVAIFEQGNLFQTRSPHQAPQEVPTVAALWSGQNQTSHWLSKATPVDFYQAKGVIQNLARVLGIEEQLTFVPETELAQLHPGRTARILLTDETIGFVGELHPNLQQELDLPQTLVMQLNLAKILTYELPVLISQPAAKYPTVERDLAMMVDQKVTNAQVLAVIKKNGGKYLHDVHVFDVYVGNQIEHHQRSLAYRLHFQNEHATLHDQQVDRAMAKITTALTRDLQAKIR